jgi:hypothetical protein
MNHGDGLPVHCQICIDSDKTTRENFLYDTTLKYDSLYDTEFFSVSYLTTYVIFLPYITLPSVLLNSSVNFSLAGPEYPWFDLWLVHVRARPNQVDREGCVYLYMD